MYKYDQYKRIYKIQAHTQCMIGLILWFNNKCFFSIKHLFLGSPAERAGLNLDDEIIEVNGLKVEAVTHTEIIIQIHKCKKDITLKIRRYLNLSENDQHRNNNNVYNMVQGETSVIDGKYLPRNGSVRSSVNRESNVPSKFDNFAFQGDDDDDAACSMDCVDVEMDEQPKSFGKNY